MFGNFFPEDRAFFEIMSKHVVKPERPQMTIWDMRIAYWIRKATRAQARVSARAPIPTPTLMHAGKHTHALTRSCARTRTHTEICSTWFYERASVVCYTYIAYLALKNFPFCLS